MTTQTPLPPVMTEMIMLSRLQGAFGWVRICTERDLHNGSTRVHIKTHQHDAWREVGTIVYPVGDALPGFHPNPKAERNDVARALQALRP